MKKKLIYMALIMLNAIINFAQTPIPTVGTDNTISSECSCLTFVSACNGEELNLYGGSVTITCSITGDPNPYSVDIPIGSDGKVCTELQNQCHDLSICVNSGNWKVCSVNGCEVQLYQEVPLWPTINGQQVGYGDLINQGTNGPCGNVVTGALNNYNSANELVICNGDPAILDLPGMDLDPNSGLCLTVNIFFPFSGSSFLVSSATYDASQVNGSQVDISALFNGLNVGGIFNNYIIEFIISCCNGTPICTPGAQKWAHIKLESDFSYSASVNAGFFPNEINFVPVTTPNGTLLPTAIFFPPSLYINQLTFTGSGVSPLGVNIDWEFLEVQCSGGSGTTTLYQGSLYATNPFTIGSLLLVNNDVECHCYRLNLTYNDGCGITTQTDSYYFKEGENCFNGRGDEGTDLRGVDEIKTGNFELLTNPIQNDMIILDRKSLLGNSIFNFLIHDTNGQLLYRKTIRMDGNRVEIPFSAKKGVYHYSIIEGDKVSSGSFLKL